MSVVAFVGSPSTVASASGGKVKGFSLGTTAVIVAPGNPQRRRIVFHNPGQQTVFVAPTIDRDGLPIAPTTSALAGTFAVFMGGLLTIEGECQTPWQAFGAVGTGNPLTVMDSNV